MLQYLPDMCNLVLCHNKQMILRGLVYKFCSCCAPQRSSILMLFTIKLYTLRRSMCGLMGLDICWCMGPFWQRCGECTIYFMTLPLTKWYTQCFCGTLVIYVQQGVGYIISMGLPGLQSAFIAISPMEVSEAGGNYLSHRHSKHYLLV